MSSSSHPCRWLRLSVLVALGGAAACAGRHGERDDRVHAAVEASGGDVSTRAAAARYRSARARADSETGHESMQFRLRDLRGDNLSDSGRGMAASVRIPMTNPWAVARERDARDEEAAVMAASVESAAVIATSERCALDANRAAGVLVGDLQGTFRAQMSEVRTWAEGWAQSETLDPLEAAQLLLEIDRRLASLDAPVIGFPAPTGAALPPLEARPPLDDSAQTIRARLAAAHPRVEEHAAAARSYRAFARRERARAAPWFGFVEFGYETGEDFGSGFEARFGIDIPLASRPRRAIERQTALAEAEELEGEAAVDELAQDAVQAVQVLSDYFARGAALAALSERGDAAETLVQRYLSERAGDPKSVARLLTEVMQTRLALIEARQRAALAACDLYMATGIEASSWPER